MVDKSAIVLAVIQRQKTYDDAAKELETSVETIKTWEQEFIAAGTGALNGTLPTQAEYQRSLNATRDKLSQVNALNAISQSLSAILELDKLLDTTIDTLYWVFGYVPSIALVDGDDLVVKGGYALDGTKVNWYDWRLPIASPKSVIAWVAANGRPLNVPDVSTDPRYVYQKVVGEVGSELALPILFKQTVLGVLDVKHKEKHTFDSDHMNVLETVAFQLAVAVENARLFETVQRRIAQLELIQTLAAKAIESSDVDAIIAHTIQSTGMILGYAGVAIGMIKPDRQSIRLATINPTEDGVSYVDYLDLPINDKTVIGATVQAGQLMLANEVSADERFALNPLRSTSQSELVVPMRSRNTLIGVINVESDKPGAFDSSDVHTLTLLADQLTVAIRSAELVEQIQQANARFQAVFEASTDGIVVWDERWRVLFINPAASRLLDSPANALIGCELYDPSAEKLLRLVEAKEDANIEFLGEHHRFGKARTLRWQTAQVAGHVTLIYDITIQVELEQTRAEMTSMLVHDLRSPLSGIVGGIEMAQDVIALGHNPKNMENFLAIARRNSNVLLDLVNSLLDIGKFESGKMQLELARLQPTTLVDEVKAVVENARSNAQILLNVDVPADLPSIMVDVSLVRRTLGNLVDNAIKFTPDKGTVGIRVAAENPSTLRFEITDTGPGVPEAYRKRIFEKYAQVPNQKGRRRGTGLGLAFCRLVAEAHHGRLWVEPNPGGGSRFCLVLADMTPTPASAQVVAVQ